MILSGTINGCDSLSKLTCDSLSQVTCDSLSQDTCDSLSHVHTLNGFITKLIGICQKICHVVLNAESARTAECNIPCTAAHT